PGLLWKLLEEAAVTVFSPEHGLAGVLEAAHGEFNELASANALILWSAWRCDLDRSLVLQTPSAFGEEKDESEVEEKLGGLGVLLNCLDPMRLPPVTDLAHVFDDAGL